MTTVTAFNMQEKLAEDYKRASEVRTLLFEGSCRRSHQPVLVYVGALARFSRGSKMNYGEADLRVS